MTKAVLQEVSIRLKNSFSGSRVSSDPMNDLSQLCYTDIMNRMATPYDIEPGYLDNWDRTHWRTGTHQAIHHTFQRVMRDDGPAKPSWHDCGIPELVCEGKIHNFTTWFTTQGNGLERHVPKLTGRGKALQGRGEEVIAMSKKMDKADACRRPGIPGRSHKGISAQKEDVRFVSGGSPMEEKVLKQLQRSKIREAERKLLKDKDVDKHRKADKKIGGVRGKFHPSLERTRKRT
jgi:hypothetical protein